MASRDLTYNLIGKDVSASSTFSSTADAGEKMTARLGGAISDLGDRVGGEFGEVISQVGDGITKLGEASDDTGAKLAGMGAAGLALSATLATIGSKDQAAQAQLKAAISATGASWSDYKDQVDKVISQGENFGHTADDTQNALSALTEATQSTSTAIGDMPVVFDLAAAKHESLTEAATQLGKVADGNTKLLKQYGITMTVTAGDTQEFATAVQLLGQRVQGQGAASVDSFNGKLDVLKAKLTDDASIIGQKFAPGLAMISGIATVAGTGIQLLTARNTAHTASELVDGAATVKTSSAQGQQTITSISLAAAMDRLRLAEIDAAIANENLGAGAATTGAEELGLSASADKAAASQNKLATASNASRLGALGMAGGMLAGAAAVGVLTDKITGSATEGLIGFDNPMAGLGLDVAKLAQNFTLAWKEGSQLSSVLDNGTKTTSGFAAALEADNGTVGTTTRQFAAGVLSANGLNTALEKSGVTAAQLGQALIGSNQQFAGVIVKLQQSGSVGKNTVQAFEELRDEFLKGQITASNYDAELTALGITTPETAAQLTALTATLSNTSAAFVSGETSADDFRAKMAAAQPTALQTQQTFYQFQDSISSLSTQLKTNGDDFRDNSDAHRQNAESALSLIQNINDMSQASVNAGDDALTTSAKTKQWNADLLSTAGSSKQAKAELQGLINQYETSPKTFAYQMILNDQSVLDALSTVDDQLSYLNGLETTDIGAYDLLKGSFNQFTLSGIKGNASGGMLNHAASGNALSGWTEVGEYGSELVGPDGRVYPHGQSEQMKRGTSSGSSGSPTYITINMPTVTAPSAQDGRNVAAALERFVGQGGKVRIGKGVN